MDRSHTALDAASQRAIPRPVVRPPSSFELFRGYASEISPTAAGLIVTPNLDHLRLLSLSKAFRRAYASADVIVNDSRFLDRLAVRGAALCLPGSELAPALLDRLPPGARVAIVGGDEAVRAYLAHAYVGLAFTFLSPSMGYVRRRAERRALVRDLLRASPDCVFICTGAPQSELFAAQLKRAGCRATLLCCGSAFHFLAGVQNRAPKAFRAAGAEWLWRFVREARTRRRYVADAAFLLARLPAFSALRLRGKADFQAFRLGAAPRGP